ncbi:MAG: hypothetical protein OXF67_08285 [Cyanobacteria bacterium MAG CAR4_bin_6]|nr:hypothetical protein [Cyanobacteria bacterium MAG CAR4_bin_6]MCY4331012.1 hypothetical protein [Cyanobacteria bacterium MAG CAR1_bin_15]
MHRPGHGEESIDRAFDREALHGRWTGDKPHQPSMDGPLAWHDFLTGF